MIPDSYLEAKGDQAGLEKAAAEALSQLYAYTGFPRSLNALGIPIDMSY